MSDFLERGQVAEFLASVHHEDEHFEAKSAANNIPDNAWETMSAFANTDGGVILFGVSEQAGGFVATGLSDAERIRQSLQTGLRNRRKISHEVSVNTDIWIEQVEGRNVLVQVVPEVRRAHKPVHLRNDTDLAYLRRGDADVQCETDEIRRMLRESQHVAADFDVIDYLDYSDLDAAAVRRYRALANEVGSRHLEGNPDDREFLTRIGVWRHDRELNRQGLTRGGVLMLGNELAIREIRPNHVIDFRLEDRPGPGGRYRDRIRWTQHLFGGWEEIAPELRRRLPVPFRLSGTTRQDDPEGEEVVREALVNLLIHTDYLESADARVIVTADGFYFENPGSSRVPVDATGLGTPNPVPATERRNQLLSSLFALINQAELAGTGLRSMRIRWRELGYHLPQFQSSVRDYRFSVFLSLRSMMSLRDREWLQSLGGPWTEDEEFALLLARDLGVVDNQQLREATGLHRTDATGVLQGLRDRGVLTQQGSGRWSSYALTSEALSVTPPHSVVTPPHNTMTPPHKQSEGRGVLDERPDDVVVVWEMLKEIARPVAEVRRTSPHTLDSVVVELCRIVPLHRRELALLLKRSSQTIDRTTIRLVKQGKLRHQLSPVSHPEQRYLTTQLAITGVA